MDKNNQKEQFKDKDNQKDKEIERLTDEELDKVSGGVREMPDGNPYVDFDDYVQIPDDKIEFLK